MSISLSAALQLGGVHHGLSAGDPAVAMGAMVARLPLPPKDQQEILAMLLSQGERMLTLLHEGVAVPHVKRPVVSAAPLLALFFLDSPLEARTDDGKRVDTIFFLSSPTIKEHLEMLSRLAAALKDPEVKKVLAERSKEALTAFQKFDGAA